MDHKITWQHLVGNFTHSGKSITVEILNRVSAVSYVREFELVLLIALTRIFLAAPVTPKRDFRKKLNSTVQKIYHY